MTDTDVKGAFDLLADETRIGILRELAAQQSGDPDGRAVEFSELRRRVGMRDSGNFNYHLDKLRGRFIERGEEGYQLTMPGMRVAGAIVRGGYGDPDLERSETVDETCSICGEQFRVAYESGMVVYGCENHFQLGNFAPPHLIERHPLVEAARFVALSSYGDMLISSSGACPQCFGDFSFDLSEPDAEELEFQVVGRCSACGLVVTAPPGVTPLLHPTIVGAMHDAGFHVFEDPLSWFLEFQQASNVETDLDAAAVEVTLETDAGEVVAVTRLADDGFSIDPVALPD